MPELPEVETIRRDLEKKILNKKIKDVLVLDKRSLKGESLSVFKKELKENKFIGIERRGKLLIFKLGLNLLSREGGMGYFGKFLLVHLKMTGQLIYTIHDIHNTIQTIAGGHSDSKNNFKLPNNHTRVIFEFSDNSKLYFNDLRVFGYLKIVNKQELEKVKQKFGVEPLSIELTTSFIQSFIKNKKTILKAFLLDQKNIAGIGNIYADEICFASQVLPSRRVNTLTKEEINKILKNTKKILKLAVEKRGTTFNNYRDSDGNKGNFIKYLKVFGRKGEKCKKCGNEIKKIKLVGRGTHYCVNCQS